MRTLMRCCTARENFLVAGVAQLVEQRIRNAKVGGSIPLTGTIFNNLLTEIDLNFQSNHGVEVFYYGF